MPKRTCKSNSELKKELPFVKKTKCDSDIRCVPSNTISSVSHGRKSEITQHLKSDKHKLALSASSSFNTELSAEQLKKTFQSIVDLTLCAICLETVSKNLIQCLNGHLLCAGCKGVLKKCPTCQGEFSLRTPSGFIVQLLEALPPRCKYHNCGQYISNEVDHEKYCIYRPTSCRLEGCDWTGQSKDIVPHLGKQHPKQFIYTCCHKVVLKNFDLNTNQTQFDSYLIGNDQFMWQEISYDVEKEALINFFHFVPGGKPDFDYFLELDASSDGMKCKIRIKLNPDPDVPKEEAPFIYIPKFMLPHFMDESNKELSFHVLVSSECV